MFSIDTIDAYKAGQTSNAVFIIAGIMICFISFVLYINICIFLLKKAHLKLFSKINIVVSFLQVFYLSLIGFTYNFTAGAEITPYFLFDSAFRLGLHLDFFDIRFVLNYSTSNSIVVGVNIMPAIVFILVNKQYKKFERLGFFDRIDNNEISFSDR